MDSVSKKHIISIIVCLLLTAAAIIPLSGCQRINMPFNGKITFHDITAVIPKNFIRDSTSSNEDLWVFEKGMYSETIIISRQDLQGDAIKVLDDYVELMLERGAESSRGKYLYTDAVMSKYIKDSEYCQEIAFCYNGSIYAFALRGGTDEEFQSLMDNINTPETTPKGN